MSMASSQISTDTVSSMSGSYIAPGTEEEAEALPSPQAASRTPSEGEVRKERALLDLPHTTHTGSGGGEGAGGFVLAGVPRDRGRGRHALRSGSLCAEESCGPGFVNWGAVMTIPRGFVALLQETPAESPDSNFAGLAAGEQDAEVTVRQAAAPCPQSGSPSVGVSWEWLWQRSLEKPSRMRA